MRNARMSCVILMLVGLIPLYADEPAKPSAGQPDAKAILKQAADAMAKLKMVSYDIEYKVTGFFSFFLPNVSGRVVIGKESPDGAKRFSCKIKIRRGESEESTEVNAGADGETYYLIDDAHKTVHADIDPQVLGKGRDGVDVAVTREFGMSRPFEDALSRGEIRYEREEKVDGHDCHVLYFKSSPTVPAMDWYFSKSDHLPRRIRFWMKDPQGGEGAGEATFLKLSVNPKFEKDPFALVVPNGYKRTDEFAP